MLNTSDHDPGSLPEPVSREAPAARLSARWRQGQAPDIRAFLAQAGELSAEELADALCVDLRERWLCGEHPRAEAYVQLYSSLCSDPEYISDLLCSEFLVRRELGEDPSLDEYRCRFPELAEQLELQIRLYDALGPARRVSSRAGSGLVDVLPPTRHSTEASAAQERAPHGAVNHRLAVPGYEILEELGRGGMGIVYKARQLSLQRLVAIKVIPLSGAGEAQVIARFHQEGLLAARLAHPNLVVAYDAGAVAGFPYFVMEFVDGAGLDELVMEWGPLPVAEACEVVRQAALGLQHIHEHGLVHRDVKPSNLMLSPSGQVKVLDLGLARFLNEPARGSRITSHGQFLGTLDYVAPEQCDDSHAVDIRADIYSLGCTLYHLLVGQPLFGAPAYESPWQKMKAHAEVPVPPIRERRPEVPEPLAAVLGRMLAKDRNRRYARPGDIVAALQPFAVGADLERFSLSTTKVSRSGGMPGQNRQPGSSCFPDILEGKARLSTVRGVTDTEIRLGLSAPFSGSARELGRGVELGIRTYLRYLNDQGGIAGREVRLIALDDGYDPDRALANMRELYERHQVFGVLCNVGTPTAEKTLPYAREKKLLFFGAFTGADLLRKTPPDPYVFNYRPSLEEETAASLKHLLGAERVHPDQVAVFAQEDAFGDAVFQGLAKTLRKCGRNPEGILRVGYIRNSIDVTGAVEEVLRHPEIRAIHMAAVYRPAAQFILKVKGARPNMLFTSVMFVGSEALAEELQQFGPEYAAGVMVTQVVPPADSQATAVLQFTEHLGNFYPHERPNSVSLEGYTAAGILAEGLRLAGRNLTTDSLVEALESIHNLDLGIGTPIHFGPSEHQGSHKVWLTVIDNH